MTDEWNMFMALSREQAADERRAAGRKLKLAGEMCEEVSPVTDRAQEIQERGEQLEDAIYDLADIVYGYCSKSIKPETLADLALGRAKEALVALLSERAAALKIVEAARAYVEAESDDWVREADPSDPDEALPPWQGSLRELVKAIAAFDAAQAGESTG